MKRFPTIRTGVDGFLRLKLHGVEWLGVRVVDQDEANDQLPKLLSTPAAKRFVCYEPALGPVDFTRIRVPISDPRPDKGDPTYASALDDHCGHTERIDWLIVGGEWGPRASPCDIEWIASAVEQCQFAGVPVFIRQLGAHVVNSSETTGPWPVGDSHLRFRSRNGNDPSEWPEDMRVREVPT